MAERKAQQKYYPPSWDPSKGSLNKFQGQHPLRDRARKLGQGILIVRFELPFNIFCTHCDKHVGMGVRYNAEKKKIGNYHSTPIHSFRFKCHLCSGWIEIHTDPKNAEYIIISGARKRVEEFSPSDAQTMEFNSVQEKEKLESDAFYKLEHGLVDLEKAKEAAPIINQLQQVNDCQWRDPYTMSQKLRSKFRQEKKARVQLEKETLAIQEKHGLGIPLLGSNLQDEQAASLVKFRGESTSSSQNVKNSIMSSSLFTSRSSSMPGKYKSTILNRVLEAEKRKRDPFNITDKDIPDKAHSHCASGLDDLALYDSD